MNALRPLSGARLATKAIDLVSVVIRIDFCEDKYICEYVYLVRVHLVCLFLGVLPFSLPICFFMDVSLFYGDKEYIQEYVDT